MVNGEKLIRRLDAVIFEAVLQAACDPMPAAARSRLKEVVGILDTAMTAMRDAMRLADVDASTVQPEGVDRKTA